MTNITVGELIKQLEQFNPNEPIDVWLDVGPATSESEIKGPVISVAEKNETVCIIYTARF